MRADRGRAERPLLDLQVGHERPKHAYRLGADLRPDAVPGQKRDLHRRPPARRLTWSPWPPPVPERSRRRRAPRRGSTTSAYFAWMSNRFASCGACARSPTHSRGTIVGQPCWSRSIAVARTQPLVVAPQRMTVSTPWETRIGGEVGAEEPRGALLQHDGLVVARVEARVDLDPAAAELELAERRRLLHPEPAVAAVRLEADRREDDRIALSPGPRRAAASWPRPRASGPSRAGTPGR